MKIATIIEQLEEIVPRYYQESYDNSGLLTGDPQAEVKKILVTLDCIEATVHEAIHAGCNLIIAHHPIIFKGLKSFTGSNYVERTVMKAIRHNVAIYAMHTNLDNIKEGVNNRICQKLGLKKLQILAPKKEFSGKTEIGSGMIGVLDKSMSAPDFLAYIKEKLQLSLIRHTKLTNVPIKRVAVCGGSGSFLLPQALKMEADAFVTADFKYHEFFDADGKLLVADVGHYESEQFTIDLIYEILQEKFPTFAVLKTSVNTNPVHYYM